MYYHAKRDTFLTPQYVQSENIHVKISNLYEIDTRSYDTVNQWLQSFFEAEKAFEVTSNHWPK